MIRIDTDFRFKNTDSPHEIVACLHDSGKTRFDSAPNGCCGARRPSTGSKPLRRYRMGQRSGIFSSAFSFYFSSFYSFSSSFYFSSFSFYPPSPPRRPSTPPSLYSLLHAAHITFFRGTRHGPVYLFEDDVHTTIASVSIVWRMLGVGYVIY